MDVGAGSGILSFFAQQAGAKRVMPRKTNVFNNFSTFLFHRFTPWRPQASPCTPPSWWPPTRWTRWSRWAIWMRNEAGWTACRIFWGSCSADFNSLYLIIALLGFNFILKTSWVALYSVVCVCVWASERSESPAHMSIFQYIQA